MAQIAFTAARTPAEHHFSERVRLQARVDALEATAAHLVEELRIKDARMERIEAHRRPHYPPAERLAILELRAACGWSQEETARRFQVTRPACTFRRRANCGCVRQSQSCL